MSTQRCEDAPRKNGLDGDSNERNAICSGQLLTVVRDEGMEGDRGQRNVGTAEAEDILLATVPHPRCPESRREMRGLRCSESCTERRSTGSCECDHTYLVCMFWERLYDKGIG